MTEPSGEIGMHQDASGCIIFLFGDLCAFFGCKIIGIAGANSVLAGRIPHGFAGEVADLREIFNQEKFFLILSGLCIAPPECGVLQLQMIKVIQLAADNCNRFSGGQLFHISGLAVI